MTRRTGLVRPVLGVLLAVLLTGCGVQLQDQAEPLPVDALRASTPTPSSTTASRETTIFFVSGRQLEGVEESIENRSANGVMAALAAGPPVGEGDLRSLLLDPLTGTPLLVVSDVSPSGEVALMRSDQFLELPAFDQVMLIGQVVLSLGEVGANRVILIDPAGAPIPVPLPDGRVQEGGVTAEDYEALVIE